MKNTSGKRWNRRTLKIMRNSLNKKPFIIVVIIFILTGSLLVFAHSPIDNRSIGAFSKSYCVEGYYNNSYHFHIGEFHKTCGVPYSDLNISVTLKPNFKAIQPYPNGVGTLHHNLTLNSSGFASFTFKSNATWDISFHGLPDSSLGGSIIPNTTLFTTNHFYYTNVYDKGLSYMGFIELFYCTLNDTQAPSTDFRFVESNGAIINLGSQGGFIHKVMPIPAPSKKEDVYGYLERRVNGTWTARGLDYRPTNIAVSSGIAVYSIPNKTFLASLVFTEYSSIMSIFFTIFVILLSIFTFGIPVSSGQAEFYMSMPYNKWHYFAGKYLTVLSVLVVTTIISIFVSYEAVYFLNGTYISYPRTLELIGLFLMICLMALSISFMFATRTKSVVKVIAYPLAILLILYYLLGDLINNFFSFIGLFYPHFASSCTTVNNISLVDPFKVFYIYISINFHIGGGLQVYYKLPYLNAIIFIIPWVVIPFIIGLIYWKKQY